MHRELITDLHSVICKVNDEWKFTSSVNDKSELESIIDDLLKVEIRLSVYERKVSSR